MTDLYNKISHLVFLKLKVKKLLFLSSHIIFFFIPNTTSYCFCCTTVPFNEKEKKKVSFQEMRIRHVAERHLAQTPTQWFHTTFLRSLLIPLPRGQEEDNPE